MERANDPAPQVREAAERIDELGLPGRDFRRHRVDSEVAASEVLHN